MQGLPVLLGFHFSLMAKQSGEVYRIINMTAMSTVYKRALFTLEGCTIMEHILEFVTAIVHAANHARLDKI